MSSREDTYSWLVPIVAVILVFAAGVFIRHTIGRSSRQQMRYGTTPFVPAASPYSSGPEGR